MEQSELNEATLEKIIQELRDDIEQRTNTFNAKDIAIFSGTIPYITTMLEYRNQRENFLNRLENMRHSLIPQFYSDELINKCQKIPQISTESPQLIINFFKDEVSRVDYVRQHILSNFQNNIELLSENEITLENYMVDISSVLKQYRLTIDKISSQTTMSYSVDDLIVMIRLMYIKHARESFLKTLFLEFKQFPLTNRHLIVTNCFSYVEDDLNKSSHSANPDVPYLLSTIEDLNNDLGRLASRFGVKPNFEVEDGQLFLYYCDQKFTSVWNKIINLQNKKINVPEVGPKINKSYYAIIDEELCKQAVTDEKLVQLLKIYFDDNDRDLNHYVKVNSEGYNQLVGIKITSQLTSGLLKRKEQLPIDRISCWFRMRILYVKYLFMAILSHYNYFEAIKYNLINKKFKWRASPSFSNLVDVVDIETDEVVILENAQKRFSDFKSTMTSVISYYTVQYENLNNDEEVKRTKIIDKHSMIEKFLEYELRYCNAKKSIIQNLYECNYHQKSDDVIHQIYEIVSERPRYHMSLYTSFEYSYKLAVNIMETQASIISSLYYFQIMHERQISVQLPSKMPLFYRPFLLKCNMAFRQFNESFPLSPFEVYQFLPFIAKFIRLGKEVALDISEGIDFRDLQFIDYMHFSVLQKMKSTIANFTSKGIFPFEYKHYPFSCDLSDSVFTLNASLYVNDLNAIENLIDLIPEVKRLRFCLTYIRFLHLSWKIQKLIIKSDLLQKVYMSQAAQNGISDTKIFAQSFSYIATQELIDVQDQFANEKLLEFALVDYEAPEFNFSDKKSLAKIISNGDLTKLQRIYQFQKFHCFILEIAGRYNYLYLDNEFLIAHFGLETEDVNAEEEEDIDLFLTQAGDVHDELIDSQEKFDVTDSNMAFVRSFLATKLLFDSQYMVENVKKANKMKDYFFLNIRAQKLLIRSLISAQAKISPMNDEQLYQLYFSEMVDSFSAFSYRLEVANVCRLERQVLLMNSFADSFIIESTNVVLVNEAGRVQNHFVVPSWADALFLVRTAPLPRQAAIFKVVLEHVASLYQILHIIRFEVSLTQKISRTSITLWENEFHLETAVLQKLLNELTRLPSGNEFDVSAKYLESKLFFLMERLELALFQAYEASYVSVSGDDVALGPSALNLHQQMVEPLHYMKGLFNSHRFIPNWMTQFMGESIELTRSEILRQLMIVDQRVDAILAGHQLHSVLESSQAIVASLDFMAIALLHERLKLCYFLLLRDKTNTSIDDPFIYFSRDVFVSGLTEWNEKVVPDASRLMIPKDDSALSYQERPVPEEKVLQAEIDVARSLCDNFILTNQIEEMKKISDLAFEHFSKPIVEIDEEPPTFSSEDRPLLENPPAVDKYFNNHLNTCRYLIVQMLMNGVKEITAGSIIEMEHLEHLLKNLSVVLTKFTDDSINRLPHAWHFVLKPYLDLAYRNMEDNKILDLFNRTMKERFNYHLNAEVALRLIDSIFELNKLNCLIHERKNQVGKEDIEQDELIAAEYDRLLYDLGSHRAYLKRQFKKQRDEIYSLVLKRIEKAGDVKFEKENVNFDSHETHENQGNVNVINLVKDDISSLRVETRKMRIFRCLAGIAAQRYFTKRIKSLEMDRVHERAKLWQSKRDFELLQSQKLEELRRAYRKLADDEIEIENLKQLLENEKQSTIQLVHWKALNSKKEDQIQNELKKFTEVEKVNISSLLSKLNNAKERLDKLNQETEYIEIETERTIRTPMRKAEQVRKKILTTKLARTEVLKTKTMPSMRPQTAFALNTESIIAQYRDENVQLMSRNEHLMAQIEMLENTRDQMPQKTVAYMSEVVPSGRTKTIIDPGRPPKQQKRTPITRPRTTMTPRKSGVLDQLLKTTLH
ncbi:hypothetical protein M9Y10_001133 [Tritrichomonas musculus]|uniref:Uncharacterized protein n=1 Tax=Tritrichomonas musculus TaxID=1915356 RepID=A0ABR2L682_9EUKA